MVQQSLWDTIEAVISELSRSVISTFHDPSFTQAEHILTLIPTQRERASAAINVCKAEVSRCKQQLDATQQRLRELENLCISIENGLDTCLSPIGALPLELVQHIAHFTVESPRHARQIMVLSQVSPKWRAAIFTMSRLFVAPNWGWAEDVLASWLSRTGTRLLHPYIAVDDSDSGKSLDIFSQTILPYLHRTQSLHIKLDGYSKDSEFPSSFSEMFQSRSLPLLESLIITGQGLGKFSLNPDQTPHLQTLHSSGRPLVLLSEQKPVFNSLGWRVKSTEDVKSLAGAAASQTAPFHLTMYAHRSKTVDYRLTVGPELRAADCWKHVTSLRLHGFRGRDQERIRSLFRQLEMVNLVSLELIELSDKVFSILAEALPPVTSRSVEKIVIGCVERRKVSAKGFLEPMSTAKANDDGELPFRNLCQFALCDFRPEEPCDWENDFEAIKTFRPNHPPPDEPGDPISGTENGSEPHPTPTAKGSLTLANELSLVEVGSLEEIKYDLIIENHGFDVKLPHYYH
ncbi:hypothetical protein DL93DRAFT_2166289 [Clavulina sp. PMI_390]|nr:hypothetical protein DL93DRAFT_2166289 [Clavulina sp. PMI_390]